MHLMLIIPQDQDEQAAVHGPKPAHCLFSQSFAGIHARIVYGYCHATTVELNSCNRDHMATHYLALHKNSAPIPVLDYGQHIFLSFITSIQYQFPAHSKVPATENYLHL